ncbi:hypothetical protein [Pandoraea sp.]|uniref:hypothetical protein n=1 Tax=Pandoraea sp. TaxID=1883445 RepID=UPI00120E9F1C|nr:hypothetical protein [Pandoraea sp.]TAL53579.1 MAG: hypothetical protein EPN80_14940 [Pandoraea sp.]TAM14878.1 MAG: hypothetical protein EPN65_20100 [Pandoraea sp.]
MKRLSCQFRLPALDAARLRWAGQRAGARLGRGGVLAVTVLVALVATERCVLKPRLQAVQSQYAAVQRALAVPLPTPARPAGELSEQARKSLQARLQEAYDVLQRRGLFVREAAYRQLPGGAGDGAQRWSVELPLTGDYRAVRGALTELAKLPALGVETLSFTRSSPADTVLTVALRITVRQEGES